ncbi:bifunctional diaminohydroxyphosphoribosylaminopyrimidine deaminase/5-amino-6-(5-phosphoribosylamino)uracil reductase [Leptospira sarikeiensis]|uniref:Riboflavin biosynthesis protein RibD n=1 Tax=Leptospira sarikeiensis TaxID=2484943 RepID=A0A4R9K638_9LEPT|nr:dihydrofolate reductase family protein [Leptospira sarikeiensis]TGL61718.1 bifunctional diaminohydroxyphosphoribosylaminopyrimidine deaminase/5-amino-6-(5-phosphoribosylamino)uracil reductase [Leptospira sarikeiensis]
MSSSLPDRIREELTRYSFVSTGYSSPNPPVACVIEDAKTGEILASGFTQRTGGNHSEREAYRILREKFPSGDIPSHNAYVTLEPCSHHGKTPPCIDLFLKEKPIRLEYGWRDTNPLVAENSGLEKLSKIGIQVVQNSELAEIASKFVFGFRSRIDKDRPAYLLKTTVSKEGYFSTGVGSREKISSLESDFFLSMLRAKVDAVLVGPNTVKVDDPGLDFRVPDFSYPNVSKHIEGKESGFSGLVSALLEYSAEKEIFQIHQDKEKDYQTLRVFFLPAQEFASEAFLEKQSKINERIGKKSAAFFLDSNKSYDPSFINRLEELSKFPYERIDFSDVLKISRILCGWGINSAMIEGGNFLYKAFSPILSEEDAILRVKSSTVSFTKGILPEWAGNFSMEWKAEIASDLWEVGRCSQG